MVSAMDILKNAVATLTSPIAIVFQLIAELIRSIQIVGLYIYFFLVVLLFFFLLVAILYGPIQIMPYWTKIKSFYQQITSAGRKFVK